MTDGYHYGFFDQLASLMRKVPVKEIKRCLKLARENGIEVTAAGLEGHHLAGGSIGELMDALILAKKTGVPATWTELMTIDLVSKQLKTDVVSVVRECAGGLREFSFDTPGKEMKGPLAGICRDGSRVRARCVVHYQLPVAHVFGSRLELLQERVGAQIMARIFDAEDPVRLRMRQSAIESELLVLAQTAMTTVRQVEVSFETA